MCVCISLSAYVTLFCLFSPKISIILLHPDKNVRKLTMNSATYKRAFKPVSSVASVDGRNNLTSGGAQQDAVSGGPMSTTSNVPNLGESHKSSNDNNDSRSRRYRSCGCFQSDCQYTGFGHFFQQLISACRSFSPTCCWFGLKNWVSQCCYVGELGHALELESTNRQSI